MNVDLFVWRVILAGAGTLQEIETHWSLCDLADANEALDLKAEIEQHQIEQAKNRRAP